MSQQTAAVFRNRLDMFVFFHLGSDAEVTVEEDAGGVRVKIVHSRVHPIGFELDEEALRSLAQDPDAFEEYLLALLTRFRKGGLGEE